MKYYYECQLEGGDFVDGHIELADDLPFDFLADALEEMTRDHTVEMQQENVVAFRWVDAP